MVPTSVAGKIIGGLAMMTGTIVLAMPIGVIGSTFASEFDKMTSAKQQMKSVNDKIEEKNIKDIYDQVSGGPSSSNLPPSAQSPAPVGISIVPQVQEAQKTNETPVPSTISVDEPIMKIIREKLNLTDKSEDDYTQDDKYLLDRSKLFYVRYRETLIKEANKKIEVNEPFHEMVGC